MLYSFPHSSRQGKKLPLTINLLGIHHLQEPVVRQSRFSLYQWIYCVEGIGELELGGRKYILRPGQVALIFPHQPHAYRALKEPWYVHLLAFSGSCCDAIMGRLRFQQPGIYHFQNGSVFQSYLSQIQEIRAASPLNKRAVLISLSKLCYSFLLDLSLSARFVPSSDTEPLSEAVKTLVGYMEEHYSQEITLELLAEQVHLSKSYMSSLFRREMRQSPMRYLMNLRMSYARR